MLVLSLFELRERNPGTTSILFPLSRWRERVRVVLGVYTIFYATLIRPTTCFLDRIATADYLCRSKW
jgi:hypothetical protein